MKCSLLFFITFIQISVSAQTVDSMAIKQVDSLIMVSRAFTGNKNFEQALKVNSSAEKLALEKLGAKSATYGRCIYNQCRILSSKGDIPNAEKICLLSKDYQEKVLGKEFLEYAGSLIILGNISSTKGGFGKADSLYLESLAYIEKKLGKENYFYGGILANLAKLYTDFGQYEKAELFHLQSVALREKVLGRDHSDFITGLNNLAAAYKKMARYEKAESIYLEAYSIVKKSTGVKQEDYALIAFNLADLYRYMGNYEKSEQLFLECLDIREKSFGKNNLSYAEGLQGLSALYIDMHIYNLAEALLLESKFIYEKIYLDTTTYAMLLNNLGHVYLMTGNLEKADLIYNESKIIFEKTFGKEHPYYAESLRNLGLVCFIKREFMKALDFFTESMDIYNKALGEGNPKIISDLTSLANIQIELGNYEKAELLYQKAKKIVGVNLGKEHPPYLNIMMGLALLYEKQKRYLESELLLKEAFELMHVKLAKSTSYLSELELEKYIIKFNVYGDQIISYLHSRQDSAVKFGILPSLCYDNALFYKGFLLKASAQLRSIRITAPKLQETNLLLKSYRRQLAAEYTKPIQMRKGVTELEEKANLAEKELARSLDGYSEALRQVKWQEIQKALKPGEAAIEFVHSDLWNKFYSNNMIYAAFILLHGNVQPVFIPLCDDKQLNSLLQNASEKKADYVNGLYALADRGASEVDRPRQLLYDLIWKPLEKELVGVKKIYFAPSGLLHRINVDAIPISETETLADLYDLIELNSTRQLVIPTEVKIENNNAILYGGIQFDQEDSIKNTEPILASRSRGELSFNFIDSTLRGGSWTYLAGTEREVNAIEKIMQTSGVQTKLKKGYEATEESFKNIGINNSPSPRILHIATHGYFFPNPKSTTKNYSLDGGQEPEFKISDHPMLRSGLIMARGNSSWKGAPTLEGREDGILTAYEISQMNLSNTELVVLSACETGLGDIQGNEGVYGLQRAFKIAGAKYLIMSLWQVPDKQTSLLMTTFYKKWLQEKMSIPDAFHAAQKELREIGLDPYQWAGFVLVE